jgi:hypothetical protein
LWTSVAVLVVCAVIGTWSALSYVDANRQLARLTGRSVGIVTGGSGTTADITWQTFHTSVAMAGNAPPIGTRTQIAYDPYNPADAIIPGAHLLADADQGRSGLAFAALAALIVPAPLLGLVWAYLDQGGVPSWCGATALCATLASWFAAIRGSDPT